MVGASVRSLLSRCLLLLLALGLALLPAQPRPLRAQGLETEGEYAIEEDYTIELTPTGDARVTDVMSYNVYDFDAYAAVFEKYPNLLTRRYRNDTDVGEIEDFDVKVNAKKAMVTVTFFSPGYAYNMGDHWSVFGFPFPPSKTSDSEVVFQGEGTMNNEFTLFEEAYFSSTYRVKLPQGSTGARFDSGEKALLYELPYRAPAAGNPLQRNRAVFIPLFGLLFVLSLVLLLGLVVSARRAPAAAPVASVPPAAAPQQSATTVPPAAPQQGPPAASSPAERRFCKSCGKPLGDKDRSFCSGCGKPL
jgi:hypothetical protein